jgi:hypothetical protein
MHRGRPLDIFKRLVMTGRLEEEEDGYHINVLMPAHTSLLLEALEGVANAEKKSCGSTFVRLNSHQGIFSAG